jgi:hypothetical protein
MNKIYKIEKYYNTFIHHCGDVHTGIDSCQGAKH